MPLYPMRFSFTPARNERIEAVVSVPDDPRSIVHGTVYDAAGRRVSGAVVRLFLCSDNREESVGDAFTDDNGEFVFGPVEAEKPYLIKVYVNGATLREVTIRPRKKRTKTTKTD